MTVNALYVSKDSYSDMFNPMDTRAAGKQFMQQIQVFNQFTQVKWPAALLYLKPERKLPGTNESLKPKTARFRREQPEKTGSDLRKGKKDNIFRERLS